MESNRDFPDILALGEAMVEFVRLPETDPDGRRAPLYRFGFGGDTSNAIVAAARQGARTGYVTAVGNDPFGSALIALWQRESISTNAVVTDTRNPTGHYFVHPVAEGHQFHYSRSGSAASQFSAQSLPVTAIHNARVFHTSAITLSISRSMCEAAREGARIATSAGTRVTFDTNLRLRLWSISDARAEIENFLPFSHTVFSSEADLEKLAQTREIDAMIAYLFAFGPELLIITRGKEGAIVATPTARHSISSPNVVAVDSTGAGDSFAGAFLAYHLETGDVALSANHAAHVSARTVAGYGAIDPIPKRNTIVPDTSLCTHHLHPD